MTAATALPPEAQEYLAAVAAALGDLPATERDDLLVEVEDSLAEAAAESAAPLAARLGPPEAFAAELRAAAGLQGTTPLPRPDSELGRRLRQLIRGLGSDPRVAALRALASELAPIWWAARGYFAVGLVAYVLDASWSTRFVIVPRLGNGVTGLLLIVLAVVMSVWIGLLTRRQGVRFPRLALALNVALLLAAVPVASRVADSFTRTLVFPLASAPAPKLPGLAYDGVPVDNVYPYSRQGKLLHDVLLYTGTGQPIDMRTDAGLDPDRRLLVTSGNMPIFNSFPVRYYEPGTHRVANPDAGPPVLIPQFATPSLVAGR
jgi:HAAS domain-containing protein